MEGVDIVMYMSVENLLYHLHTELRYKNERIDENRKMYNLCLLIHDEKTAMKYNNELERLVREADELVTTIKVIEKRVS